MFKILLSLSVVTVLCFGAVGCSSSNKDTGAATQKQSTPAATTPVQSAPAATTTPTSDVRQEITAGPKMVVDPNGTATITGSVKNLTTQVITMSTVTLELYDASGAAVAKVTVEKINFGGGQTWDFSVQQPNAAKAVSVKVVDLGSL